MVKDALKDIFDFEDPVALSKLEVQKALNHPNIAKIFEIYSDEKSVVAIMELCQTNLFKWMVKQEYDEKYYEKVRNIFRQITEAVMYLEKNKVVHNDIKIANVILCEGVAKLTDFGLAVREKDTKGFWEYVYYFAPEMNQKGYTNKVNSWQLGMILYAFLATRFTRDIIPQPISDSIYIKKLNDREMYKLVKETPIQIPEEVKLKTPEGYDLLIKLLQADPNLRIPVSEILSHPYF